MTTEIAREHRGVAITDRLADLRDAEFGADQQLVRAFEPRLPQVGERAHRAKTAKRQLEGAAAHAGHCDDAFHAHVFACMNLDVAQRAPQIRRFGLHLAQMFRAGGLRHPSWTWLWGRLVKVAARKTERDNLVCWIAE